MSPDRRASAPVAIVCFLALFGASAGLRAQEQKSAPPSDAKQGQEASGPKKPVRKPDQVLTNDPVALMAVRHGGAQQGNSGSGTTQPDAAAQQAGAPATQDANGTADDTAKKAAEIASLQQQIQDKTKKIAFLMRLFVNDERPFLNDPSNQSVDGAIQDRRKYEQDELLYETAELAKLKNRLNQLTAVH